MSKARYSVFQPPPESDLRYLLGSIEHGRERTAAERANRVLVDLAALENEPGEIESLLLSHHVGLHLARLERIAVLVVNRTGMGERVAQHLGANMRVFTSRSDAVAWLEEEDSMPDWLATGP